MKSVLFDFFHNLDSTKKSGLRLGHFHLFGTVWLFNSFPSFRIRSPLGKRKVKRKAYITKQDGHIQYGTKKNIYEYPIDFF